jgi:hypothetical protein
MSGPQLKLQEVRSEEIPAEIATPEAKGPGGQRRKVTFRAQPLQSRGPKSRRARVAALGNMPTGQIMGMSNLVGVGNAG